MKLRILSWNVHGLPAPFSKHRAARLGRIALAISHEQPDFVALQEVWAGSLRLLAGVRGDYTAHYARSRGGNTLGGLLLLVRRGSGWSAGADSMRFRRYSSYAARHRIWEADGLAGKGALLLPVEHRSGERLWLVDTHLQSRYAGSDYHKVRRAQIHELTRWVGELGKAEPIVIAGDFNTPADSDPLHESIASLGRDVTEEVRSTGDGVTNFPVHASAGWIDYVLVAPPAAGAAAGRTRLIRNRAADDPYSDHHGLVCDIEVARA